MMADGIEQLKPSKCVMCNRPAVMLALNGESLCDYHGAINKLIESNKSKR